MELMNKLFDSFQKTAQRIETLPAYSVPENDIRYHSYNSGTILDNYSSQNWCKSIKNWTEQGKTIERIRVVPKKFNPYLSFEFTCYEKNILAGEKISAIYEDDYRKICNKTGDIWIFDSNTFLQMNYDENGTFIGSELIEDDSFMEIFNKLKESSFDIEKIYQKIRNQEFDMY